MTAPSAEREAQIEEAITEFASAHNHMGQRLAYALRSHRPGSGDVIDLNDTEQSKRCRAAYIALKAAIEGQASAARQGEPVALVRTWTKNGEGHGELVDWLNGADALPDGEHELYARSSGAEALRSNEQKT